MSKTKERIRDSQLRYKQGLGQNFIYDDALLQALVAASGVTKQDDVLEIGPGSGSMTAHLCDAAHHVLSVELDERLIPLLEAFLREKPNFTLVQGDILSLNLREVTSPLQKPISVVANIPYYITTPLITLLLSCGVPIRRMALMVQKGLIEQQSVPGDRRVRRLTLTPKAEEVKRMMDEDHEKFEATLRKGLSEEELATLFSLLDRLQENLRGMDVKEGTEKA